MQSRSARLVSRSRLQLCLGRACGRQGFMVSRAFAKRDTQSDSRQPNAAARMVLHVAQSLRTPLFVFSSFGWGRGVVGGALVELVSSGLGLAVWVVAVSCGHGTDRLPINQRVDAVQCEMHSLLALLALLYPPKTSESWSLSGPCSTPRNSAQAVARL